MLNMCVESLKLEFFILCRKLEFINEIILFFYNILLIN
jgi:hypothetical protein